MIRRRSLAVLALMVVLAIAPSLVLAAEVCAPHCCPAAAIDGAGEAGDCRAGLANRSCCTEASTPIALVGAPVVDGPALPIAMDFVAAVRPEPRPPSRGRAEALLALRTSPLRLSVVLLI